MSGRWVLAVAAGLCPCLIATGSWAQTNEVSVQFHGFQDTRGVTVLTPNVDVSQDVTDRISVKGSYAMDAISQASDSCARCHHHGIDTKRKVGGASVTGKFGSLKISAGGAYSRENFYRSTTAHTSVSRDLKNGNTTVAGGYSFSLNRPTVHPTPEVRNQYANGGFASITQTLSRTTIGQMGYELGIVTGYQDNPYLRTSVNGVMTLGHVPDRRTRHTLTGRLRQALPGDTFVEADYRRYFDDWGVRSTAVSAGLSHRFASQVLGRFAYRWYSQAGASFYQPSYAGPVPRYFTADFRLAPFTSGLYTGEVVVTPRRRLLWLPDGAGFTLQYDRYRADNGFDAAIFSTGVRIPIRLRDLTN
ncbi:MAG: DUF3570 domain-containing protein [Vicinamibacterales bacterium]